MAQDKPTPGAFLPPQGEAFNVGLDDFLIALPAPGEPLDHELLQVLLGHIHQMGQGAHHHHVGGSRVSGGTGQLVEGHSKAPRVFLQLELAGVVHNDAAFSDLGAVSVIGLPVKGHQHIHIVTGAQYLGNR